MFNRELFQRTLDETGLTKGEVAHLIGVSRQTIYDWMVDGEPKQVYLRHLVTRVCDRLLLAVKQNVLPMPRTLPKPNRETRINKMFSRIHDIKPTTA